MSKIITPKVSPKNRRIDWINLLAGTHNLICGCDEPLQHTIEEILHQEPTIKVPCPRCHGSGPVDTTTGDDVLGDVDLGAFFADDFGEQKEDADTR